MSIIQIQLMCVHVLTHVTLHHPLQFLLLWQTITSVTLGIQTVSSLPFLEMILSGMVLDVESTTPAVTGTHHHGSGKRYLPQHVMTSR